MDKPLLIFLLFLLPILSNAQGERFTLNNHEFEIRSEVVNNEWNTKDTVQKLYRVEYDTAKYVLKFYKFKDEGGDCNNLFWYKEEMKVIGDSVVFTTHFFQKTGIDPIPEWRKQVYIVNPDGKLLLTFDKYKYYRSTDWVDE